MLDSTTHNIDTSRVRNQCNHAIYIKYSNTIVGKINFTSFSCLAWHWICLVNLKGLSCQGLHPLLPHISSNLGDRFFSFHLLFFPQALYPYHPLHDWISSWSQDSWEMKRCHPLKYPPPCSPATSWQSGVIPFVVYSTNLNTCIYPLTQGGLVDFQHSESGKWIQSMGERAGIGWASDAVVWFWTCVSRHICEANRSNASQTIRIPL